MFSPAVGSYTGTGAAINVAIGFTPAYVKVWNDTDRDEYWEWCTGMAAGTAIATSTAVATLASNGITAYAGASGTTSAGFTAGSSLSESGKTFRYVAFRAP